MPKVLYHPKSFQQFFLALTNEKMKLTQESKLTNFCLKQVGGSLTMSKAGLTEIGVGRDLKGRG
jgi:hypothetical protein